MHWPRVVYNLAIVIWVLVAAGAQALSDDRAVPNKPILLVSNSELGQANVFLATTQSLLGDYPSAEIHYASFPSISGAVSAASLRVSTSAGARPITFHPLNGTTYVDKIAEQGFRVRDLPHRPGLLGAATALKDAATLLLPWNGPEHVGIYEEIHRVIESVDPGLVVVDSMFAPAHDAVLQTQVKHVVLAPNSMRDFIFTEQPQGEALWKFPVYVLPLSLFCEDSTLTMVQNGLCIPIPTPVASHPFQLPCLGTDVLQHYLLVLFRPYPRADGVSEIPWNPGPRGSTAPDHGHVHHAHRLVATDRVSDGHSPECPTVRPHRFAARAAVDRRSRSGLMAGRGPNSPRQSRLAC